MPSENDDTILVSVDEQILSVPERYLETPVSRPAADGGPRNVRPIAINDLWFRFWMPSLRPVLRRRLSVPNYAIETDKADFGEVDDQYIVQVQLQAAWNPKTTWVTPATKIHNRTRGMIAKNVSVADDDRLLEMVSEVYLPDRRFFSIGVGGDDLPEIVLDCTAEIPPFVNALCSGSFWWPDESLGLFMMFPTRHRNQWREIAQAAHRFLTQWRVQAPQ